MHGVPRARVEVSSFAAGAGDRELDPGQCRSGAAIVLGLRRLGSRDGAGVAMAAVEADAAREAIAQLEALARDLEARGYAARLVTVGDFAHVRVQHRTVRQLSEIVRVAAASDGGWWFWWSWGEPIARVSDVDAAAFKIAYVLTPASA